MAGLGAIEANFLPQCGARPAADGCKSDMFNKITVDSQCRIAYPRGKMKRILSSLFCGLIVASVGCGADAPPAPCDGVATLCEQGLVRACNEATNDFDAPVPCDAGSICLATACAPLSAEMQASGEALADYAQTYLDYAAQMSLDLSASLAAAQMQYFLSDGSPHEFAAAATIIFNATHQGHSTLAFGSPSWADCDRRVEGGFPQSLDSYYGACTRLAGDEILVTFVDPQEGFNPLGLAKGDRVVSLTDGDGVVWAGEALLARIFEMPLCRASTPNESARRDVAGANIMAVLTPGDILTIAAPSGETREVVAPAFSSRFWACYDAAVRPEFNDAFHVSQRPDGVVVVLLPTFFSHPDHPFPSPLTGASYRQWITESVNAVTEAVSAFENITGLVYDIRGNTGGAQEYALALLARMPAETGAVGKCYARIAKSSPPEVSDEVEYPFPYSFLGGDNLPAPPIDSLGKIRQAVVTDGFSSSAADWMAHYARSKGIPVVGRPASGSYGYTAGSSYVNRDIVSENEANPRLINYISGAHCLDAQGQPLEGLAAVDVAVELSAEDLAAGIDTQLEAAVAEVLAPAP